MEIGARVTHRNAATSSVGSFWMKPTVSLMRSSLFPLEGKAQ